MNFAFKDKGHKSLEYCCILKIDCVHNFTVNEHENICIAGLNRRAGYATEYKDKRTASDLSTIRTASDLSTIQFA